MVLEYSIKQKKRKKRYLFLFTDVLLVTNKRGTSFVPRYYVHLGSDIQVEEVNDSSDVEFPELEFRLYAPQRNFIFFAGSRAQKKYWVQDLDDAINKRPSAQLGAYSFY
ncbi:FYVE, RhoGEF and PH domain-containing protein 3 [Balamuthia mandrillaris]